jgi:hypothetical protein
VDGGRTDGRIDRAQLSSASHVLVSVSSVTDSDVRFIRCDLTESIFCKKFFAVLIAGFHRGLNQANTPMGCYAGSVVLLTDVSGES